jgi:hypothetical protein
MITIKQNGVIALIFIWVGFVCAISFMEAWLKFQAPNITTALGLGIGQLVFSALNKVEITLAAIIILIQLVLNSLSLKQLLLSTFLPVIIILSIQSLWLLPMLDERASNIIQNIKVPESHAHFWFVLLEILKVICLILYGYKLLNAKK